MFFFENENHAREFIERNHSHLVWQIGVRLREMCLDKASLFGFVTLKNSNVVVGVGDNHNISVSFAKGLDSQHVISYPGIRVLFSINKPFSVEMYKYIKKECKYIYEKTISLQKNESLVVDGKCYSCYFIANEDTLIGSVNFPRPYENVKIFKRGEGRVCFWLLSDDGAARFLFILKALENLNDENLLRVAKEVIYHESQVVRKESFRIINLLSPDIAFFYHGMIES